MRYRRYMRYMRYKRYRRYRRYRRPSLTILSKNPCPVMAEFLQ